MNSLGGAAQFSVFTSRDLPLHLVVQRSVIVTADEGYGDSGYDEIPAGATVELLIEVL